MTDNTKETAHTDVSTDTTQTGSDTHSHAASKADPASMTDKTDSSRSAKATSFASAGKKPHGKKPSMNALCHGIFSEELILPGESESEFLEVYDGYKEEWKPNGRSEQQAVFDSAYWEWVKRRAIRMAHGRFHLDPLARKAREKGITDFGEILALGAAEQKVIEENDRAFANTLTELDKLFEKVRNTPYGTNTTPDGKHIPTELWKMSSDISRSMELLKESIAEHKKVVRTLDDSLNFFASAYDPEFLEKIISILGMIDVRIEKTLRRLTSLKEYKRTVASYSQPLPIGLHPVWMTPT